MTPLETLDAIHEVANLSLRQYLENRERVTNGLPIELPSLPWWNTDPNRPYLGHADLTGASLGYANLSGANLAEATLDRANLMNANLWSATLRGADLGSANLVGASLQDTDLQEAYLKGADLSGADLRRAHIEDADLRGADLRGANLTSVSFSRDTELRGARRHLNDNPIPGWVVERGIVVRRNML